MYKWQLITKNEMMDWCSGKYNPKKSINDDLESFFEDRLLDEATTKPVTPSDAATYFLPSLTDEELELVEQKDPNYLETFSFPPLGPPDREVLPSKSESKYVLGISYRKTYFITSSHHYRNFNGF